MRVEEGETAKSISWEGRFLDAKNEFTVFVAFFFAAEDDEMV